ncbi:hypothetical protein [Phenylobacterium sp. J367]|uniref:hypothetical protein n=1 Tax=Phenylobacterium sp. J367 TaxID=2898435 RepID=UPI002151414C|nr:hypothetical protein [Phenylobacterium sp. J367]MCR5879989.1 hypothetical protein [Phenylobacterium sp. J367]
MEGEQEGALGRLALGVRTEAHPGERRLARDVLLGHQEIDHLHAGAVLDHEIDGGVLRADPALAGDLGQGLAGQRLQLRVLEADQQGALGAGVALQVLEPLGRSAHLGQDLGPGGGVLQPLDPLLHAAGLNPGRHGRVETGGAGGVGVHVGRDPQALGAGGLDLRDGLVELAPVLLAGRLQVVDLGRRAGAAGDLDQLVDRFQQARAFRAHVTDVDPAAAPGLGGQGDQLVRFGEGAGRIDQARADAQGAVLHGLHDQGPHLRELLGRRVHVVLAEDVHPHRLRPHEGGDVLRDALRLEMAQILVERGPGDVVLDVGLVAHRVGLLGVAPGAHGGPFAHHLQGDALAKLRLAAAVVEQALGRPGQHVDEARRDGLARGVHLRLRRARSLRSHIHDAVAADCDIALEGLAARAVVDLAAADHQVVARLGEGGGGEQQAQARGHGEGLHAESSPRLEGG